MTGGAVPVTRAGPDRNVVVTGAGGLVGRALLRALAADGCGRGGLWALDLREPLPGERLPGVEYRALDVRSPLLGDLLAEAGADVVVHLAAVVTPPPAMTRAEQRDIDVGGTENVLSACRRAGVGRIVVTSSGAAYGYHADNPAWLGEDHPLRGNPEFAYADHKRLVEELLARHRAEHPQLAQLVFRLGTVLGESVSNQITALFEKPVVLGVAGAQAPFVFVWEDDVVACLVAGVRGDATGIYNLVGDGTMTMREIAAALGKPYLPLPASWIAAALGFLKRRGLTAYGPEQVGFLRYRPVLSNRKLKQDFGYRPAVDAPTAFRRWREGRKRRNVVITGAAGGIGRALAARFAAAGDRVALLDLDGGGAEEAAAGLRAAGGVARAEGLDVRDLEACRAAIGRVVAAWGGVDVLVNGAGITHRSLFAVTDPAVIARVMAVNFNGAVHCTAAALPSLLRRRGALVALSSVAGFAPLLGRTGYSASKHALHGFFDSLRSEVEGAGVLVLLCCPSFVDTGIDGRALGGDGGPARTVKPVVGRLAAPAEVAEAVFRGVARRRSLVLLGPVGRAAWWISRLAPGTYARMMRRRVRAEFEG